MPSQPPTESPTTASSRLSRTFGLLVSLSPLLTILLGVWGASLDHRLKEAETQLRTRAQELEESRDRVSRLTFVHEHLFPDLLGANAQRRELAVKLIRLTIPEDADILFAGFQVSADPYIQAAGRIGAKTVQDERLIQLLDQLVGPSKSSRVAAATAILAEYGSYTGSVSYLLAFLQPPRLQALSPDGLVNVLLVLKELDAQAWTPQQAAATVAALGALSQDSTRLGPLSRTRIAELHARVLTLQQHE